jgi:hypothetical protein
VVVVRVVMRNTLSHAVCRFDHDPDHPPTTTPSTNDHTLLQGCTLQYDSVYNSEQSPGAIRSKDLVLVVQRGGEMGW